MPILLRGLMKTNEHSTRILDFSKASSNLVTFLEKDSSISPIPKPSLYVKNGDLDHNTSSSIHGDLSRTVISPLSMSLVNALTDHFSEAPKDRDEKQYSTDKQSTQFYRGTGEVHQINAI